MYRKLSLILMLLLTATLVLPSVAQENVTLRYFTFSAAPDYLEELDTIIAAFELENPTITVEVSSAPFSDYFTLLQADVVGNDAPDVFELNYENFVTYAANGTLLNIDEYLTGEAPYYPRALEAFQYNGEQLALPETFSTVLLFYNADLFDQAELDYPTAEWTWSDATVAAEAISP
ncbi:MAG: extracellular solute-binding protein, partial [Phototrophicales bacterium]|nr:extracellular solute-binding protein [Phototrophicales bacterium]